MKKSKLICGMAVLTMTLCLAACGKSGSGSNSSLPSYGSYGSNGTEAGVSEEGESAETSVTVQDGMTPGTLYFINLKDRDTSVMRSMSLSGNRAGSEEFNSMPKSTEGIRCIYDLDEWVEIYMDTDINYGIRVWIMKHKEDQSVYETMKFSDQMEDIVTFCDLYHDAGAEEELPWGSFYVNSDEFEPGYYDLVFVYQGKALARFVTYFYPQGTLEEKTDAELRKLMSVPTAE